MITQKLKSCVVVLLHIVPHFVIVSMSGYYSPTESLSYFKVIVLDYGVAEILSYNDSVT